jgi:hypothetical protein
MHSSSSEIVALKTTTVLRKLRVIEEPAVDHMWGNQVPCLMNRKWLKNIARPRRIELPICLGLVANR